MTKQAIWTQKYQVSTFLVNPQKKLGLFGLLNLIQDTAWIHATHLGHGYESMLKEKLAWVLTRQKVKMDEWPHWGDEVTLKTWIRPLQGIVASRDFEIFVDEKKIGECNTQWLTINLETRRPAERNIPLTGDEFRNDPPLMIEAAKIQLPKDVVEVAQFNVRNSDLDQNGHVNNTKYAQWILDAISAEKHYVYKLLEYEVNFLAETYSGDVITILEKELSPDRFLFEGLRKKDNKIVFGATMKVEPRQSN